MRASDSEAPRFFRGQAPGVDAPLGSSPSVRPRSSACESWPDAALNASFVASAPIVQGASLSERRNMPGSTELQPSLSLCLRNETKTVTLHGGDGAASLHCLCDGAELQAAAAFAMDQGAECASHACFLSDKLRHNHGAVWLAQSSTCKARHLNGCRTGTLHCLSDCGLFWSRLSSSRCSVAAACTVRLRLPSESQYTALSKLAGPLCARQLPVRCSCKRTIFSVWMLQRWARLTCSQ